MKDLAFEVFSVALPWYLPLILNAYLMEIGVVLRFYLNKRLDMVYTNILVE